MQLGKLLIEGTVTDGSVRQGTNDRGPWRMESVFVPSKRDVFEVNLGDDWAGKVKVGDFLTVEVAPRVYQQRVTYGITDMIELVGEDGSVKWDAKSSV